jgi:hypothetical protein
MSGRKILVIITLCGIAVLGLLFKFHNPDDIWHLWNIPNMHPVFYDLWYLLVGIESSAKGQNTQLAPFDLVGGYPKIWAVFALLGLNSNDTFWLALVIIFLFWLSVFFFARGVDGYTAVWMSALIFSPAAMLCYERANLDLVIFVLLSAALVLDQFSRLLSFGLVSLAAILKVYPVLGFVYLLKASRDRFLLWAGIGVGVFIVYAVSIGHALQGIVSYIPRDSLFNYGAEVVGFRIFEISGSKMLSNIGVLLAYLLVYLLIMVALYLSHRVSNRPVVADSRFMDGFRIGALFYIGTFIEGNSFNYRLIFLIFCLPQIIIWMGTLGSLHFETRIVFFALIASCWGMLLLRFLPVDLAFWLDEMSNWVLFAGLLYLIFVSLPDWLIKEIDSFFERLRFRGKKIAVDPGSNGTL